MAELTYQAAQARLVLSDQLYTIAEQCGMSDDWVMETVTQIENEVKEQTGIDLSEA